MLLDSRNTRPLVCYFHLSTGLHSRSRLIRAWTSDWACVDFCSYERSELAARRDEGWEHEPVVAVLWGLYISVTLFSCVSVQMFDSKKVGFTCFLYIMMLIQSWCSWYNLDGRSEGGERCTCVVESVRSLANHHALINSSYGGDSIVSASITRIHHRITKIRQRCDINVQHSLELLGKTLISSALMQNSYHVMHGHDLACAIHARGCECM